MKKFNGDLVITQGNKNDFRDLKEVTGYLYIRQGVKFDAPVLATIGGYLDIESEASCNAPVLATIGGSLYIRQGVKFDAPVLATIGGYLDIRQGVKLNSPLIRSRDGKVYFNGKEYEPVIKDGIIFYTEKIKTSKGIKIYTGYLKLAVVEGKVVGEPGYIAEKEGFSAHGTTLKSAMGDLQFKIVAEKLKNDPILPETEITVMYYRTVTGACDAGCRDFMQRNNIPYRVEGNKTIEESTMLAKDLLPLLEKNNAYGVSKFKSLVSWA